jgi:hypothetical protein
VRDKAYDLTSTSDCATFSKVMGGATGDSWLILACVERLIELEEFIEIPNPISSWAQHRIICRYMGR